MVVVKKESLAAVGEFWVRGGVYLLLGHAADPEHFTAYVGKAPSGLISRVASHVRNREEPWHRALLIASVRPDGLDSAAIGWLEGRLYDLLDLASAAHLTNRNRPRDESLQAYDRQVLEQFVAPVAAVLRALGYSPDSPDQQPPLGHEVNGWELWGASSGDGSLTPVSALRDRLGPEGPREVTAAVRGNQPAVPASPDAAQPNSRERRLGGRGPIRNEARLTDLVAVGLIPPAAVLVSPLRGGGHRARYLEDGSVEYSGVAYNSLSSAARAAVGRATNGWTFWHVEVDGRALPLAELRSRYVGGE